MKKNHGRHSSRMTMILAVLILLVLTAGIVTGVILIRRSRLNTLINQQNYVASKLIELGNYENGQILAFQSEQTKSNPVSRELIVLSAGFSSDFAFGISCADTYLQDGEDAILSETKAVLASVEAVAASYQTGYRSNYAQQDFLDNESRDTLLKLLLRVQNTIDVKKSGSDIQAMIDLYSSSAPDPILIQTLESTKTPLSRKLQTVFSYTAGNYDHAFALAKDLAEEQNTLENRALLANLMVSGNLSQEITGIPADPALSEERDALILQYNQLSQQYYSARDAQIQQELNAQMETVLKDIETVNTAMNREPAGRAVNYFIANTPLTQRKSAGYRFELAYLYYLAGETIRSHSLLKDLFLKNYEADDPTAQLVDQLIDTYRTVIAGMDDDSSVHTVLNKTAKTLHMPEVPYYGNRTPFSVSFYDYLLDLLEQMYNGLIIRAIDTSAFPTVRVTVNVPSVTDKVLKKRSFSVVDMDRSINRIRLLNPESIEVISGCSIMLVVDHSGSMMGMRMDNTKASVISFTRSLDAGVDLGLAAFNQSAQLLTPLGHSRSEILQNVDRLSADGNTAIWSGLKAAGDELIANGSARKVIILLSDGVDGDTSHIDDVLETLRLHNIYVYTIGFDGADTAYLSHIANTCGGKFIAADSTSMLAEIYSTISEYMVNDYILEFKADKDLEEFSRHLQIEVKTNDAVSDSDYHVGVSFDKIADESALAPKYDCFRQIGGSYTGASPY